VFGSFNRPEKLDQETFSAWMQILERVPTACLWLFARHPATQTNLRQHASRLGVDPDRLVFAGPVSHDAHLCRLQQVTLGLDSFVYGAHTTASDLLRVGVPLVSRRGPNTASRVASSLLHRCGVADTLVADSTSAYVERAVHLATHPAALEAVRGRLLNNRAPLYDPAGMAHSLESLFEQWVQRAAVPTPSDPSSVP
jgi:predicted O-linked N-acetylglucosamine transferase (SPINDLY family)